ncbi:MAG: hypothetical protein NTW13_05940 [Candidatus Omnitrophica bacterium]|nr:hypothetical protein [Candidatus Omnitrophota bacterium]
MSKKALSLLEVIVATIILAITMLGLVNLFISGKRLTLHAHYRMSAGELGKFFLEPLQLQVIGQLNSCLSGNGKNPACPTADSGTQSSKDPNSKINYGSDYTITSLIDDHGNPLGLRKVKLEVKWDERAP